jgi:drug/metabolite transporter (DMT)-like permease
MDIKAKDSFYITGMVLAWSAYFLLSKWAVDYTQSAFVAGFLLRAAAFVILTVYLCVKKKFTRLFKTGKLALILLLIGVFGYLLDTFANIGFQHSSVGTGTVLLKTDILMANLAAIIIFKEKLYWIDWLGTAVMLVGVIFVLNIDFANFKFNWYDIFFILSALAVTINAFIIKGAQQKFAADSDTIAYYNNFTVMLLFLVSALITKDIKVLTSITLDAKFFGLVILGGLAQSLIYIFYYRNLKRYPVWQVKLFLLLVPIVSLIIGAICFGEKLVWLQFVGIALVLIGAVFTLFRNKIIKKPINT